MSRLLHAVLVVCVVTTVLASTPGALAAGPYGLDSPSTVDVPDQTVMGDGEFLTVRDIARVEKGEGFVVQTTAPESATYWVELRNMHGIVVDSSASLRGSDSTTFTTDHLRPGSYVAVLRDRGTVRAVLPVVIEGYDVSVEAPGSAEAESDVTVSAELTAAPTAPDMERVELIVVDESNGKVVVQQPMTADGSGYTTTFRLDDPGEYTLGVNVRGASTVRGFDELLGFSDAHAVSLTEPESPSDESAAAAATPESGTATPSASATPTASTTVPDGVITRNPTDDPTSESNDPATVVLSLLFGLLLLIGFGLLYVLRF